MRTSDELPERLPDLLARVENPRSWFEFGGKVFTVVTTSVVKQKSSKQFCHLAEEIAKAGSRIAQEWHIPPVRLLLAYDKQMFKICVLISTTIRFALVMSVHCGHNAVFITFC